MPRVYIPPLLRPQAGGAEWLDVPGRSVREVIESLSQQYPALGTALVEDDSLRAGLTVVVDGDVSPSGLLQKVAPESEIHFLPAIGGG
jgi:molybdopterin synthase sulfur carrier subunit